MGVRNKGRNAIEVDGRRFVWYVHRETHTRIVSEDKRFIVAYRLLGEPELTVTGSEFPAILVDLASTQSFARPSSPTKAQPVLLARSSVGHYPRRSKNRSTQRSSTKRRSLVGVVHGRSAVSP